MEFPSRRRPHLSRPKAAATAATATGAGSEASRSVPSVAWAANSAFRWPLVASCATARRSNGVATCGQKSAAAAPRTAGHATPPEPGVLPVGRIDSVERPDGEASDGAFPLLARTESGVPTNLPQFLSYLLLQIVLHADGHDGLGESAVERSVKAMTEVLPMRHIHVVLKHGPAKRRTRART